MKVLTGIAVCTLMMTLSACGPHARDLEVKRLAKVVKTLQGQMVNQDQRLETLTNKMIIMKQARSGFESDPNVMRPDLQVVRLTPNPDDDVGLAQELVEITVEHRKNDTLMPSVDEVV